jgi:hypothetical protein
VMAWPSAPQTPAIKSNTITSIKVIDSPYSFQNQNRYPQISQIRI